MGREGALSRSAFSRWAPAPPGAAVSHPATKAADLDLGRWLSSRAATSGVPPAATRRGGRCAAGTMWPLFGRHKPGGRAGRWEGRGVAGARALGEQRDPRTRPRSPRPGQAASRRPPGQPSAGQKLEGGGERKEGEEGERNKKMPKERGDGRGGEGGKERKDRREERRKTQGGEGRGRAGAREKKGGKKEGKETKRAEKKGDGGVGETDRQTDVQSAQEASAKS